MRASKILLIVMIQLVAQTSYAGLSDPHELAETSQLDPAVLQEDSVWRRMSKTVTGTVTGVTNTVTNTVSETVTGTVSTVGGWLQKGVDLLSGKEPVKPAPIAKRASDVPEEPAPAATDTTATAVPEEQDFNVQLPPEATAEATATEVNQLKATLGASTTQEATPSSDLREMKQQLKSQSMTKVIREAKKPGANLKLTKAGVPFFPLEIKKTVKMPNGKTKVVMAPLKNIPRLDVGREPMLSRRDLVLKEYKLPLTEVTESKPLSSPEIVADSQIRTVTSLQIGQAPAATSLENSRFGIDKVISHDSITKALPKITKEVKVVDRPVKLLTEAEEKMLAAVILYEKGDRCHSLMGVLDELTKNEKFGREATFYLGACAQKLKMFSLAFERLGSLIRAEDAVFARSAIDLLAPGLLAEYQVPFSKMIRDLKNQSLISEKLRDQVNYYTAKGAFKEGDYTEARLFAEKVTESSANYGDAQYLIGISWFSLGNLTKAEGKLDMLRQWLAKQKSTDKNLNSLSAINLARIKFKQGRYKDALALYMAIDKDHPLWVQGLVEQGWTQLAVDDFSGAIGNMYSLHSPYFKSVYKPESFVVRTIGYLNICQYGDAYRTLSWLEHEYRPWVEQIHTYVESKKLASDYYDTAKTYLKGKSDQEVDGLPFQIIREAARQRSFLNYQTSLNEKADETGRYDTVEGQIKAERMSLKGRIEKATRRFKELQAKIKAGPKDQQLATWKQQAKLERETVISLRYQVQILDDSKQAWADLKTQTIVKIDKQRYDLRESAGRSLVTTLLGIKSDMATVLDNNEFLRYEVFAGSGENIRYQVAGGEVAQAARLPASAKPAKLMNWSFEGEYWEDEIGSYRSSLQNNCPETGKMTEYFKQKETDAGGAPKGQAAIEKGAN